MTETLYIQSATTLAIRYERYCAIIDAMELAILENVGKENIEEYELHDGQTRIKTIYRGIESMTKAVEILEKQKNKLANQLNGRVTALRPWQGMRK